jgi:hypothetical protein
MIQPPTPGSELSVSILSLGSCPAELGKRLVSVSPASAFVAENVTQYAPASRPAWSPPARRPAGTPAVQFQHANFMHRRRPLSPCTAKCRSVQRSP